MNQLTSQQRKLVYLCGIVALLMPIIILGMPGAEGGKGGGVLSQLRNEYELGESTIGQVDPSSAAMNLVLLGLRGVAVNSLWMSAAEQQEKKEWGKLKSTVNSIILLQPHYTEVWRFQGWNLAYNVSSAWDDIEDRFYWVKEGIKFEDRGTIRNNKATELYYDCGTFTGPKIGRSDEWRHFRRFFMSDPDVETYGGKPDAGVNPQSIDNYLTAREWFLTANEFERNYPQRIMARCLFRKYPVQMRIDLAQVYQREGLFGEKTRVAWNQSFEDLTRVYGQERYHGDVGRFTGFFQMESTDEVYANLAKENNVPESLQRMATDHYQKMVNYNAWRTIALSSSDTLVMEAHREIHDGQQFFLEGRTNPIGPEGDKPSEAQAMLESGMTKLALMLVKYPVLATHDDIIERGIMATEFYVRLHELNGVALPDRYPLKALRESHPNVIAKMTMRFNRELAGMR